MEKPDSNGFINITWPSKNVPHGGIFHTKVVERSATQQNFLKVLLEESKLTIAQRRNSALRLREETSKEIPKVTQTSIVRPRTSRRRSLSAIRESGVLEAEHYRPLRRGEDREKLKDKLANSMTYGDVELKQPKPSNVISKPGSKIPTKKEQWNDLVTQIRERAEWLADMESLGHAGPHRELINDQIAERLRALDALGLDSQCSTARSNKSGFSVLPSERSVHSDESLRNSAHSNGVCAGKEGQKITTKRNASKNKKYDEHVADYKKLSPLQYSPRRRV